MFVITLFFLYQENITLIFTIYLNNKLIYYTPQVDTQYIEGVNTQSAYIYSQGLNCGFLSQSTGGQEEKSEQKAEREKLWVIRVFTQPSITP